MMGIISRKNLFCLSNTAAVRNFQLLVKIEKGPHRLTELPASDLRPNLRWNLFDEIVDRDTETLLPVDDPRREDPEEEEK